jgi:hypothetical protein
MRTKQHELIDLDDSRDAARGGLNDHLASGGKASELANALAALDLATVLPRAVSVLAPPVTRDTQVLRPDLLLGHSGAVVANDDRIAAQCIGQRDPDMVRVGIPGIVDQLFQRRFRRPIGLAEDGGEARVNLSGGTTSEPTDA